MSSRLISIAGFNKAVLLAELYKLAREKQLKDIQLGISENYAVLEAPESIDLASAEKFILAFSANIRDLFGVKLEIDLSRSSVDPTSYNKHNSSRTEPAPFETAVVLLQSRAVPPRVDVSSHSSASRVSASPKNVAPLLFGLEKKLILDKPHSFSVNAPKFVAATKLDELDDSQPDAVLIADSKNAADGPGFDQKSAKDIFISNAPIPTHKGDQYKRAALIQFLQNMGLLKGVLEINVPPYSHRVHIISDSAEHRQRVFEALKKLMEENLGFTLSDRELHRAQYPSEMFCRLVQAQVPFEENSISPSIGSRALPITTTNLNGSLEIKFPYGSREDIRKLALYLLYNLQNPSLAMFTCDIQNLPSLMDRIALLPQLPDSNIEAMFEGYHDIIKIYNSRIANGGDVARLVIEDYRKLIAEFIKNARKEPSLNDVIRDLEQGFMRLRCGTTADISVLGQALTCEMGPQIHITPRQPRKMFGQFVLPLDVDQSELDSPNENAPFQPTHTVGIMDISGSMGEKDTRTVVVHEEGDDYQIQEEVPETERLFFLRQGLKETVKVLADRPNQYFSLIGYNDKSRLVCRRMHVTHQSLPEIYRLIDNLTPGGGTMALPALRMLRGVIQANENLLVIFGTDGILSDGDPGFADEVMAIFKTLPHLPILKTFLMDAAEDSEEADNMKVMAGLSDDDGSQFLLMPRREMNDKLKTLIFSSINRFGDPIQVQFNVTGCSPVNTLITPGRLNETRVRYLGIPQLLIDRAKQSDGKLQIQFKCGHKVLPPIDLDCHALAAVPNKSSAAQRQAYSNDWIDQQIYFKANVLPTRFKTLGFLEQLKILSDIQQVATEFGMKETGELLEQRINRTRNGIEAKYLHEQLLSPTRNRIITRVLHKLTSIPSKFGSSLASGLRARQNEGWTIRDQWMYLVSDIKGEADKYKFLNTILMQAQDEVDKEILNTVAELVETAARGRFELEHAFLVNIQKALKESKPGTLLATISEYIRNRVKNCVDSEQAVKRKAAKQASPYAKPKLLHGKLHINYSDGSDDEGEQISVEKMPIPDLGWAQMEDELDSLENSKALIISKLKSNAQPKDSKRDSEASSQLQAQQLQAQPVARVAVSTAEVVDANDTDDALSLLIKNGFVFDEPDATPHRQDNRDNHAPSQHAAAFPRIPVPKTFTLVSSNGIPAIMGLATPAATSAQIERPVTADDGQVYDQKQLDEMLSLYKMSLVTGKSIKKTVTTKGSLAEALDKYKQGDLKAAIEILNECPITNDPIKDPVNCMGCGQTYTKKMGPTQCPMCRGTELISGETVMQYLKTWREELAQRNLDKAGASPTV